MKTQKIVSGYYRHNRSGRIIQNKNDKWNVWNEVTGEVYGIFNSKKEAVNYCDSEAEIESWDYE